MATLPDTYIIIYTGSGSYYVPDTPEAHEALHYATTRDACGTLHFPQFGGEELALFVRAIEGWILSTPANRAAFNAILEREREEREPQRDAWDA